MVLLPTTTLRATTGGPSASTYTLRPGRDADVAAIADVYYAAFADNQPGALPDNLMDVLFGPSFRAHPRDTKALLAHIIAPRLWSVQYRLSALVDDASGQVVGFVCFKRPLTEVSFYERWLSPRTWLDTLRSALHTLATIIRRPGPALDAMRAAAFARAFADIEPRVRCSPRRRAAWYLSIVAVDPAHQGLGLGGDLLRAVLEHVERVGARQPLRTPNDAGKSDAEAAAAGVTTEVEEEGGPAVWLTARKGTEGLYRKLGFVKVLDANTGPLSAWNGGAVMFRGLQGVEDLPDGA